MVAAGSITALLGGNGAGKSTTLSAPLGVTRAHAARIAVHWSGTIAPAARLTGRRPPSGCRRCSPGWRAPRLASGG